MGAGAAGTAGGLELSGYSPGDRERWVAEDATRKRSDRDDFARDRARIVHSASLRRLSTKTQVWQAGTDDFVRNRLTHSLEVAQIGRELAGALGCNRDVVDAACLAHDIGHPPFGHFGETVLDGVAADIGGFEGNAQTFRLLTRLEAKRMTADGVSAGLNLTRATLDASMKYPWQRGQGPYPTTKFGVYADDVPVFEFVRSDNGAGTSIEAQIMDWSDDVAYSVHDVEDAIAARAIEPRALRGASERTAVVRCAHSRYAPDLAEAVLESAYDELVRRDLPTSFDATRADLARLKDMASTLIGRFAAAPEDATRRRYGPGPLVRYEAGLLVPDDVRAQVAALKAMAAHFVMFTAARGAQLERQREVIEFLVGYFQDDDARLDPMFRADLIEASDESARLRIIVDQVASLTDGRAWKLFTEEGAVRRGRKDAAWQA